MRGFSQDDILGLSDLKMKNRVTLYKYYKYQNIGLKPELIKKLDSSNRF
jgi:hypothetical protein